MVVEGKDALVNKPWLLREHTMRCASPPPPQPRAPFLLEAASAALTSAPSTRVEGGSCGSRPHGGSVRHWDRLEVPGCSDWLAFIYTLAWLETGGVGGWG